MRYIILILMTVVLCSGSENTIILGDISVQLDSQWTIIGHKNSGPMKVIALQIPNPADEGTSESTNLIVSIYDITDVQGTLALSNTLLAVKEAIEEEHNKWKIMIWSGSQDAVKYSILDAALEAKEIKSSVLVRLALPILPNNEKDYESKMKIRLLRLLDSIKIK